MNMDAATAFVKKWQNRQGKEKEDTVPFWYDFCHNVLEVDKFFEFAQTEKPVWISGYNNGPKVKNTVPIAQSQMEFDGSPASKKKSTKKAIDIYIPSSRIIIEQKSLGIDLNESSEQSDGANLTPFEQASRYDTGLKPSEKARYIIVCNFQEFRIYDLENQGDLFGGDYVEVTLDELPRQLDVFSCLIREHKDELKKQKELSSEAAVLLGNLYDVLRIEYELQGWPQHDLVILCVRLLFCLYAEDSGLFKKNAFHDFLLHKKPGQNDGEMREALHRLFQTLNTKKPERDPFLSRELKELPYVNGGLFADESEIPYFTIDSQHKLLFDCSQEFLWDRISPTIFGALFESIVSGELRRTGGMHYTSLENIHKITQPLFLDDFELEFQKAGNSAEKLRALQDKISSVTFFDPACGSGNFLTQTYIDLRKLEDRILERLIDPDGTGQGALATDPSIQQKVSISQFYGIEINDFAVSVAQTALQIALHQCNEATNRILLNKIETLPLKKNEQIVQGNALRTDWNEVLPAEECSYIFGNPPFVGGMQMSREQKEEMKSVFSSMKGFGELDYVCAWYMKASDYLLNQTRCAFVSTNSICQGLPVGIFWKKMKEDKSLEIDFAYRPFVWNNEAIDTAHVHCVIIGFSKKPGFSNKAIFTDSESIAASHINGYLFDAPDVYVAETSDPLCPVPPMRFGSMARSKGFTLTLEQKVEFIRENPLCEKWIRPYWGADEFLKGKERYCLWLMGADPREVQQCPSVLKRIEQVRSERAASKAADTRKLAETPMLFAQIAQPTGEGHYLLVPCVSSEKRPYVPIAFVSNKIIASNATHLVPNAKLYHFGVMSSQFHNAWMRMVAGRLKSDYRYAKDLVYNTFIWPQPTDSQRERIEACAQAVLDERDKYPDIPIGKMYAGLVLYPDLAKAHKELDVAVEKAYDVRFNGDEEKIVAHLSKLYADATNKE